jgi:hypothetical protein
VPSDGLVDNRVLGQEPRDSGRAARRLLAIQTTTHETKAFAVHDAKSSIGFYVTPPHKPSQRPTSLDAGPNRTRSRAATDPSHAYRPRSSSDPRQARGSAPPQLDLRQLKSRR